MDTFSFDPAEGFKSANSYPDPSNESETRSQLMKPSEQIRDYINNNIVPALAHTVNADVPSNAKFTDTVYDDTSVKDRLTTLEADVNGHKINADVPSNAKFTDTVYDDTSLSAKITALETRVKALEDASSN